MDLIITEEERRFLLALARESIRARLENQKPVYPSLKREKHSALEKPCGAFVTLRKGSALRGCIGRMSAAAPLEETVRALAIEAALDDPRFPPLAKEELDLVSLEISALSPMELRGDPRTVRVGTHGLYLTLGGRSGVLLPQVPLEQGWNLDEYLDYICVKAGLPPRSYNAAGAKLYTFTAVVFGETPIGEDEPFN